MTSPLETTLLLTDQQGSVLHTVNAQAHKPIAYTAYGHRPAESGMTCLLGFNGELPDPVTGHYLLGNGYRAFNPVLMRFNSPDSLSPFGEGGLNGYAYCGGDPVNYQDPTGHTPAFLKSALRRLKIIRPSARLAGNVNIRPHVALKNGLMENVTYITDDVLAIESKGGSKLTVIGHGNSEPFSGSHEMLTGSGTLSPDKLYSSLIQANITPNKYKKIELLMCHSADGSGVSFAEQFSNLAGRPVTGHRGTVTAAPAISEIRYNPQNGSYHQNKLTKFKKNPYKNGSSAHAEFNYDPHTYHPEHRRNYFSS